MTKRIMGVAIVLVAVCLLAALTPGLWAQPPGGTDAPRSLSELQPAETARQAMRGDRVSPGKRTDAPPTAPAQGGLIFFNNQAAFDAAIGDAGKVLKGFEVFPWSAIPGSLFGIDDPLDFNTSVPGWIKPGILLDNITYQSNLDPFGANGPNPRGGTGLSLFTTGFIGATHNGLTANHFVDSFDILSGPPAGDNHTAMAMQVVSLNDSPGGSAVVVTVYDKDDNVIGTTSPFSAPANQGGIFVGILATQGTIGRVNIYDTNGPKAFESEGLYSLAVYVVPLPTAACCFDDGSCSIEEEADCLLLGGTYQGAGISCKPNRCPQPPPPCPWDFDGSGDVDVKDLLALLGAWGACPK